MGLELIECHASRRIKVHFNGRLLSTFSEPKGDRMWIINVSDLPHVTYFYHTKYHWDDEYWCLGRSNGTFDVVMDSPSEEMLEILNHIKIEDKIWRT